MKVLTIGTDKKIFDPDSAVVLRQKKYAAHMEELHILVCTIGGKSPLQNQQIGNLFLYPTNSSSRLSCFFDAYNIGRNIILERKFVDGQSVISTQDPFETGFVGYRLSKKYKIPLQLQIHTDFLSPYFITSFLNRLRVQVARFLVLWADGLRVVSKKIAESLKHSIPNLRVEPTVLPIFVDIEKIKNTPITIDLKKQFPKFDFIVFMASRLTKEKQIETALHAFVEVVKKYPHAGLVIAGSGSERTTFEKIMWNLGLSHNVVFIGWQDDLISYYKTADLFLLTSVYEGYGMTLIEAAAAGLPIVTTDVGIAREIIRDGYNSFVCPVGDTYCIIQGICSLISDPAQRELFKSRLPDSITSVAISQESYVLTYVGLLADLMKAA